MSVSFTPQQEFEFLRMIDIEAYAGHFQNDERLAGLSHDLTMRQEAVVAETKRNEIGRPAQHAVAISIAAVSLSFRQSSIMPKLNSAARACASASPVTRNTSTRSATP